MYYLRMYRAGFPGWKLAARLGLPLLVRVIVRYDEEAKSYWATSPDLDGLAICADTLDELKTEAVVACGELLELQLACKPAHAATRLMYQEPAFIAT
jgi:hypothetical protein